MDPAVSDLRQAVDSATLMFANVGFKALMFNDVTTPRELEELRRSNPVPRRRIERILEEQLERAEEIIRDRHVVMEALVAKMMAREVVLWREFAQLFETIRVTRVNAA